MHQDRIVHWLSCLPTTCNATDTAADETRETTPRKKRKHAQVVTPPASSHHGANQVAIVAVVMPEDTDGHEASTPKRRKLQPADPLATPRGPLAPADSASQMNSGSVVTDSSANISMPRNPSPTKQLMALDLSDYPLEFALLDHLETNPAAAPGLSKLFSRILDFTEGLGVIPDTHRDKLPQSMHRISDRNFFDSNNDGELDRKGPIAPCADMEHIVQSSSFCVREQLDEAGWGSEVHYHILMAALRRPLAPVRDGLVNFIQATTAATHSYLLGRARSKMVDFCVYIDAPLLPDPRVADAIKLVRTLSGFKTLNHTSYYLLRDKPVSLSIECKKPGGSLDNAALQMGVWHTAQWNFLSRLAGIRGFDLASLPCLPGIIVQGEQWFFVASTRQANTTILWTKRSIGSSTNLRGVYQIVRTIQFLAWWSETWYWPWFQRHILGLSDPVSADVAVED
ncbi:hypothetical protein ColTof4_14432 [Colletotrichum tofieldiae]|nr:hypothetical protein ColTof3_14847 [Colletotrichum tofieldiae]GKT82009.1 hypothetical protein ColTof4_14432 [Colletotrichum tofieldiae]